MSKKWRQNIGYSSLALGLMGIVIGIAAIINFSPVLFSIKESVISIAIGLLLAFVGIALNWPSDEERLEDIGKDD